MVERIPQARAEGPMVLTRHAILDYTQTLRDRGLTRESQAIYRRFLDQLYDLLPEDKAIGEGTLGELCARMEGVGYAPQTINSFLSVVNGFVEFYGRRDLREERRHGLPQEVQPELTRQEYLRLLSAARALGLDRDYLLVKVFGTLGITTLELHALTVEAVRTGMAPCGDDPRPIPDGLREELLDYAAEQGIAAGPIFRNSKGLPMSRTRVGGAIKDLSWEAEVDPEKCTPRCLKKLYHQTRRSVWEAVSGLYEQICARVLEEVPYGAGNDSTDRWAVSGVFRYQLSQDLTGGLSFQMMGEGEAVGL